MDRENVWKQYRSILQEELATAFGCTEPVAIAYAAAVARQKLGAMPEKMEISCSGNIIKNVKSVIVPNADGMRGIEVAALLGAVGGKPEKKLAVLIDITGEDIDETRKLLEKKICTVHALQGGSNLHIIVDVTAGEHQAKVEILGGHTHIVCIEKDGAVVFQQPYEEEGQTRDYDCLTFDGILDYAIHGPLDDELVHLLLRQADLNRTIAEEGLKGEYGAAVGRTLLDSYGTDVKIRAAAYAAAGSDARMSGCELPVVINSGSGNQGITVSMPVLQYAQELNVSQERLCRALALSNLVAIHLKRLVGRLSAFCGVVSASCGSGAGITFLCGGTRDQICNTVINTLGNVSGIVCDGAKPSCAAKICASVQAAILGHEMAMRGRCFHSGDGIIKENIEETIRSVAKIGRDGMKETDQVVLDIMTDCAF